MSHSFEITGSSRAQQTLMKFKNRIKPKPNLVQYRTNLVYFWLGYRQTEFRIEPSNPKIREFLKKFYNMCILYSLS